VRWAAQARGSVSVLVCARACIVWRSELSAEDYERLLQLDDHAVKTKGASKSAINSIPVSMYAAKAAVGDEQPPSCCVCMETLATGDVVKWLPCTHVFHAACIGEWGPKPRRCALVGRAVGDRCSRLPCDCERPPPSRVRP
jgi:hypothetical protein